MKKNVKSIGKKIRPVLRYYDVKKAAIFGSFARGEGKKGSDVDILVEFRGQKSLLDLASLKIKLEKSLHNKVDVITYNSLHPLLRERILREQKVIL